MEKCININLSNELFYTILELLALLDMLNNISNSANNLTVVDCFLSQIIYNFYDVICRER